MSLEKVMDNFSLEEQELIRGFLFTRPHGKDSFVYPQPLVAGEELSPLMSAYSRTHIGMQTRVLQFLDSEKTGQTRAILPVIKIMMDVFRNPDGTLVVSRKTGNFNKRWTLAHGHASIKEGTNLFGYSEDISDITLKRITGHPLNHPQVKSTRYLLYRKSLDLALGDEDLAALPNSERFLQHVGWMNQRYLEVSEQLEDLAFRHKDTKSVVDYLKQPAVIEMELQKRLNEEQRIDPEFIPDDSWLLKERENITKGLEDPAIRRDIGKFVLDYSRVYLLAVNRTSLGYSVDARALEEIITELISSPRLEDQKRGYSLWEEAKKIAPVLLGEKSHIEVDQWRIKNEIELRNCLADKFDQLNTEERPERQVTMITPRDIEMYTDRFNAALVIFQYVNCSLQKIMRNISEDDIKEVLSKAHEHRGKYDNIHPAISHGGLMFELTMAYHGYRDIFRHRRGSRTTQLLTTKLGFETPEILGVFGLDQEYKEAMIKCKEIYDEAALVSPHIAEKLVPFGAVCRALHSWQPNQIAYIGRLRTDIEKGNLTYVFAIREMMAQVSRIMPETTKFFRCDNKIYPAHLWKKGYDWFDEEV